MTNPPQGNDDETRDPGKRDEQPREEPGPAAGASRLDPDQQRTQPTPFVEPTQLAQPYGGPAQPYGHPGPQYGQHAQPYEYPGQQYGAGPGPQYGPPGQPYGQPG